MALNIIFPLGTVLLIWRIARELWTRAGAACGLGSDVHGPLPVTVKAEARANQADDRQ